MYMKDVKTAIKASIEAETESSDDERHWTQKKQRLERRRGILRQLAHKCENVDILIATQGWHSAKDALHELIPAIYNLKVDIRNFPHLSNYLKMCYWPSTK